MRSRTGQRPRNQPQHNKEQTQPRTNLQTGQHVGQLRFQNEVKRINDIVIHLQRIVRLAAGPKFAHARRVVRFHTLFKSSCVMFAKLYQYFADMPPTEVVSEFSSESLPLVSRKLSRKQIPPTKRLLDAAYGGHAAVVLELLQSGVGFNAVNESGNKPIHVAAYEGHVHILKILLDAGPLQPFLSTSDVQLRHGCPRQAPPSTSTVGETTHHCISQQETTTKRRSSS